MQKNNLMCGGSSGALFAAEARSHEAKQPYGAGDKVVYDDKEYQAEVKVDGAKALIAAYDRLMSGPKSTRPTSRAVRKTISRIKAGLSTNGSWRSWPAVKKENA